MFELNAEDEDGHIKKLGVFESLHKCALEISEWELNSSNVGMNVIDCEINAYDLVAKCTYVYAPPDLSQGPPGPYDPDRPYDWIIKSNVDVKT